MKIWDLFCVNLAKVQSKETLWCKIKNKNVWLCTISIWLFDSLYVQIVYGEAQDNLRSCRKTWSSGFTQTCAAAIKAIGGKPNTTRYYDRNSNFHLNCQMLIICNKTLKNCIFLCLIPQLTSFAFLFFSSLTSCSQLPM